jgi:NAD+ synthase (glutamine-hydrolysing)
LFVGEKMTMAEVTQALETMFPDQPPRQLEQWGARFATLFSESIYKWVQAPISLHVGNLDLERERALQLPVVSRRQWQEPHD